MKTYAPKTLRGADLRLLMDELASSPAEVAKFLEVTERSVWRWLADGTAPRAVLCALWHETPRGRETCAFDVGNDLVITRSTVQIQKQDLATGEKQLRYLLATCDSGAANDPLMRGPVLKQAALSRGLAGCLALDLGFFRLGLETPGGGA